MEEAERERLEEMLEAITLAANAEQAREEIDELNQLAIQAQAVEASDTEAKLSRLKGLLHKEGIFDHAQKRLFIFTEFKDTLDYLRDKPKGWGSSVGCIYGGMKPGSRDESGTRLYAEQQFREGEIQVLVKMLPPNKACFSSDGVFVQSDKSIEAYGGWSGDIIFFGQKGASVIRGITPENTVDNVTANRHTCADG